MNVNNLKMENVTSNKLKFHWNTHRYM